MSSASLSAKEILRRVYTEIVKRRSRVKVVIAEDSELSERPIFVIGPKRSGTTLMRYVLDSHSRICCPPETNFVGQFKGLLSDQSAKVGLDALGFDEHHVVRAIRDLCIYFWGNYAKAKGKPRWADKSTTYVDHLEFILRLFPESQFIMIHRHGLDQSHSLSRGGSVVEKSVEAFKKPMEDPRVAATRYWIEKTRRMLEFHKRHPRICISIRYEDLCTNPETELRSVLSFLAEPWEPEILRYHLFDHDKGPEHGRTIVMKGFHVSKDNHRTWPPEVVERCEKLAAPMLEALNYEIRC